MQTLRIFIVPFERISRVEPPVHRIVKSRPEIVHVQGRIELLPTITKAGLRDSRPCSCDCGSVRLVVVAASDSCADVSHLTRAAMTIGKTVSWICSGRGALAQDIVANDITHE